MFLTTALVLLVDPAEAGGLGIVATGGAHTEQVFYYSSRSPEGAPYPDFDDYDQYDMTQTLPNLGAGVELLLGDRDDAILGVFRFYYNNDGAQKNPADLDSDQRGDETSPVASEDVVANVRDTARHIGIGSVGLSWGFLGEPDGFQFGGIGQIGAGLVTSDHTEFLLVGLGPMITYKVARQAQLFADVQYEVRIRNELQHSVAAFAGARYLFD